MGEAQGVAQLSGDGIPPGDGRLARSADIRYKGQINEVEVPVPAGPLDAAALTQLVADFHRRYETVYGQGAGFHEARVEIVTYRVRASAVSAKPRIVALPEGDREASREARAGNAACAIVDLSDAGLRNAAVRARLSVVAAWLPMIALSVRDDSQTRATAREVGARAFFRKPVDAAALLDSIAWVTRSA